MGLILFLGLTGLSIVWLLLMVVGFLARGTAWRVGIVVAAEVVAYVTVAGLILWFVVEAYQ